jgi:hypothetical protein
MLQFSVPKDCLFFLYFWHITLLCCFVQVFGAVCCNNPSICLSLDGWEALSVTIFNCWNYLKEFFLDEKFKRNWLLQTFQFKSLKKFLLKNFSHVCSLCHWVFHSSSKLASWQSVAIAENLLQQAWNCGLHFPDIWELLCQWCELDLFSIFWELRMCLSTCCLIKLVSLPNAVIYSYV